MAEEHKINRMSCIMVGNPKSSDRSAKRREKKKEKCLLKRTVKAKENQEVDRERPMEVNSKHSDESEYYGINITGNVLLEEADKIGEEQEVNIEGPPGEQKPDFNNKRLESLKSKKKQQLLEEAAKADQRGVCYLSRIPPRMDHVKLRQILSHYGEIQRIYLAPEEATARVPHKQANHKRGGGSQEQAFSEGWVEFTKKSVAKRVSNILNGEQIGGRKRSSFYYDLWNIKYLSKFKWDALTEEIAYKNATREQKLALEISAARRERDFYLSKVDKSRALSSIEERIKRKRKVQQEPKTDSELPVTQQATKVIRRFPQKEPVADNSTQCKPRLSKDILAGVFVGS